MKKEQLIGMLKNALAYIPEGHNLKLDEEYEFSTEYDDFVLVGFTRREGALLVVLEGDVTMLLEELSKYDLSFICEQTEIFDFIVSKGFTIHPSGARLMEANLRKDLDDGKTSIPTKDGKHLMLGGRRFDAWSFEDEDDEFNTAIYFDGAIHRVNSIDLEFYSSIPD